jgi:broad specificity phosphatase PhoE
MRPSATRIGVAVGQETWSAFNAILRGQPEVSLTTTGRRVAETTIESLRHKNPAESS